MAAKVRIGTVHVPAGNLAVGKSMVIQLNVAVPANMPVGTYKLLAQVNSDNAIRESDVGNNVATAAGDTNIVWQFGDFAGRRGVKLTLSDSTGAAATFGLTGGGFGTVVAVVADGGGFDVELLQRPRGAT